MDSTSHMSQTILFATVCNDDFTNALALLLWSTCHHNPSFDYPVKVYHRGDLSEANQDKLRFVYKKLTFDNVNRSEYAKKIPHYLALEVFREYDPDRVVFIDSDIVCVGDISYLTEVNAPIAACLDYDFKWPFGLRVPSALSPIARLNTGVFSLNKTFRNPETYQALYAYLDEFPDDFQKGMAWSDQGIMNRHFRWQSKFIFPYIYNGRKNLYPNKTFTKGREAALGAVRLLHYGGGFKPFLGGLRHAPPESKHHKYSELHAIYYEYWAKMVEDLKVDWTLPS